MKYKFLIYPRLMQQNQKLNLKGVIDEAQLQIAYAAVHAITTGTDSLAWRRENLRRHPPRVV